MKLITLPAYRLPTLLSATKEGLKHYDRGASRHFFPVHLALNYILVLKYAKK
jgi:hypothetical protein